MKNIILELLLGMLPLIIITICIKIRKQKINNIINLIFYGILSIIISLILGDKILANLPILNYFEKIKGLPSYIYFLIVAGFNEELSKYICLKLSKPKNKKEIFINILYISLIFTIYEDFLYIGISTFSLSMALSRALTPAHLLFNLIMFFFLQKVYDYKKNAKIKAIILEILALLIPIIMHGLWDFTIAQFNITASTMNPILLLIIAIICYVPIIITIFKFLKPEENDQTNEEIKKSLFDKILKPIKLIVIIIFTLMAFLAIKNNNYEMHKNIKFRINC